MARQTWMGVGVAALGMTLVLGAKQGVAQDSTQGANTAQMGQVSGTMSSSSSAEDAADAQLQVAQLRTQVAQLRQQVVQLRAQLAQASSGSSSSSSAGQGVGGSGSAGTGSADNSSSSSDNRSNGNPASGGNSASGASSVGASASGDSGFALANVLHTGRVRFVSRQQLVLADDAGGSSTLPLANTVQVVQNGRPVALGSLQEGTRVRTSANLVTPGNPVVRIEVLSHGKAPSSGRAQPQ